MGPITFEIQNLRLCVKDPFLAKQGAARIKAGSVFPCLPLIVLCLLPEWSFGFGLYFLTAAWGFE